MKLKIIFAATLSVLLFPLCAGAADFYLAPAAERLSTGESAITVKLHTGGDAINAVSGKIEVPEGIDISRIVTGSSAILIWIERPVAGRTILFSGITPGGFRGDVALFTLGYARKSAAQASLEVSEGEAIKSDGLGSAAPIRSIAFALPAEGKESGVQIEGKDADMPEPFAISIGRDAKAFDGAYFASFAAQDKKSGVQRYEWASVWSSAPSDADWQAATSPLALSGALAMKKIFVKAIDEDGNARISSVDGPRRYAVYWIGIILVLTICALFYSARRFSSRLS